MVQQVVVDALARRTTCCGECSESCRFWHGSKESTESCQGAQPTDAIVADGLPAEETDKPSMLSLVALGYMA